MEEKYKMATMKKVPVVVAVLQYSTCTSLLWYPLPKRFLESRSGNVVLAGPASLAQ